ncbi:cadherin repeat domain-containing protein [Butyrivibrio sp. MC2021]|uniref:cadherin repeat domain-containing protein n=1 Tax=Butyrivibrio sp. MC2021 TaxID=1408306 RepID=UPI000479D914|nr:cadherin repeat domain-containing protein [Butyrivibrio sp. MC2021]
MKKTFGALGRIFCAFLSASTILTSIPFTANASEFETESVIEAEEVFAEDEDDGDEGEEETPSTPSKYTFKYSGNVSIDPEEEPYGIVKVSGKGYYIAEGTDSIDVTFKIDPKYMLAYASEDAYDISATLGGKKIPGSDIEVTVEDDRVKINYYFDEDSKHNIILGNFAVDIKTEVKKTFSFSGKCGNTTVMTMDTDEEDLLGLTLIDGKYFYGYEDRSISAGFRVKNGYTVAKDDKGKEMVEVMYGNTALKPGQYKFENYDEELEFSFNYSDVLGKAKKVVLQDISIKVTFVSLKTSYTVSFDSSKMSLDTSATEDMDGIIYENGKCYICGNASEISLPFKLGKGYFVARNKEDEFEVKVTIDGVETSDFSFDADEETSQASINVSFPWDDHDEPIIGNVVISPVFVTYKKVTFSCNYDHISEICVDEDINVVEDNKKTFEWLEGTEHKFDLELKDGYEVTGVKYGTSVLKANEDDDVYQFVVTGDGKIEITTASDKSPYTVSWDTKYLTLITSGLGGCLYIDGKCYVRKDYSSISLSFKVKSGYGVPVDEAGNADANVSIKGSKPEDVNCYFDAETSTLEVTISFPTDDKTNTILGNVTIAPVIKPFRNMVFSYNSKHVSDIEIDGETIELVKEEDGALKWLEGTKHYFTIETNDGYEVKSVKYGSSELKPDKTGKYKLVVGADAKVVITTGSDKSNYTVSCNSNLMTLITSDEDYELDGCVFANDKCYVRKNVTGVTLSYKLKKGYYVPYRDDDEYECQVSATISGSKTDDVTTRYDDFDDIITVSVDFPLDKDGNPVIGNVVISPVVRQYKKVTFSCNYKQIYYVDVNGYGSADETEKTVLVRGEKPLVFEIETRDGYEVRSVTCDSNELVANENFKYSMTVTKDTTVKITSGKFSGPVLDPVEVKFFYNNKELTELPSNMTVIEGFAYDKKAKKYYTTKATGGVYHYIYLGVQGNEKDEFDKVVYKYGNAKVENIFWRDHNSGIPFSYVAAVDRKDVKKAVSKALPISIYLYINMPKHTITYDISGDGDFCDFYQYDPLLLSYRKVSGHTENEVLDGDDLYFKVDDKDLRSYIKKKVTSVTCNGKKLIPQNDGKDSYYVLKNVTKDVVIKPVIKALSDPDEPSEPDEPGEERDYYEVKISSDEGISSVRAVADGIYLKNQAREQGRYLYQIPKQSSVKLYVSSKDKYETAKVVQDGSKAVKLKDGAVTLKLKADTEISISSEALSYLCYQKVSDKKASEVVCESAARLKAASYEVYELYVKKGNDILPINKVSVTGLSKHPGFSTLSSDKKKVTIACSKAADIKKTISVALSCDGLKKEKKISFSIYRPITKVSVQGFKNNKASQTYGSSVSYKVSIDKGADYRDLKFFCDLSGEKNAGLSYDPERRTVTVDTFKGNRLSEYPVYFYFQDSAGNMIGDKYTIEPVAAKFGKLQAGIVDITNEGFTLAALRPKEAYGLKNLYYCVSMRDPSDREDDWGMNRPDIMQRYEAKEGITEISVWLPQKWLLGFDDGNYEIRISLCQFRDNLSNNSGNMVSLNVLSKSEVLTIPVSGTSPCYYEKKLKLSPGTKAFYWGEKNVALAAASFSKATNCRRIARVTIEGSSEKDKYSSEDKNSIIGIDNVNGLISLSDSERLYPGKYTLTAYPVGEGKAAKLKFTVKAPVTAIEITSADTTIIKSAGKAATGKFKVTCKSTIHGRDYKPTKAGVKYTISSDNEELLKYVSVKNGVITVKKGYCLDYDEAKNRFTVTVSATDRAGKGATASYEFVVTQKSKK